MSSDQGLIFAFLKFFIYVGMGLPGLNQYYAADKVSCSRTQTVTPPAMRLNSSNPLIPSPMLCQLCHCALYNSDHSSCSDA